MGVGEDGVIGCRSGEGDRNIHTYLHTSKAAAVEPADSLPTTVVSSKTTPTYSAIWTISLLDNYGQIITGCINHPPDAERSETMDYISSELASLLKSYPLAKFIIATDRRHMYAT